MFLGTIVPSMSEVRKGQGGERCWSGSSELLREPKQGTATLVVDLAKVV